MPTRPKRPVVNRAREAEGLNIEAPPFPLTPSRPNGTMSAYPELTPTNLKDAKSSARPTPVEPKAEGRSSMAERRGGPAEILTIRDVAAYLKLPVSTVYRLAERRELP